MKLPPPSGSPGAEQPQQSSRLPVVTSLFRPRRELGTLLLATALALLLGLLLMRLASLPRPAGATWMLAAAAGLLAVALAVLVVATARRWRLEGAELHTRMAALMEARDAAERAGSAKSAFLADMSHEIRTPFHGLMGLLTLLRETALSARQIDLLRTATDSADHLLTLLGDILDASQLESGRMTLAPAPTDVHALLREVEALMRPQALAKSIALHVDVDPAVPARVRADATRVRQVVINLVSNAIKFTDHGAVVVDLRRTEDGHGRPELAFVVTDTGIGIEAPALAGLFSRFMQPLSSGPRTHAGAGLGLEISRSLARLMGGDISVRSRPGEGSVFWFRLPLEPVLADAVPAEDPPWLHRPALRPLQVLVAEDHPVNRQYMAVLLDNLGHEAHFTSDGQQAVEAARSRRFDVVLMDLQMPVCDGIEATRAIRRLADPANSTLPIVALTADAFDETRERCLVAGMNDVLTKPVSPHKLAAVLRRFFGSAAVGGAVASDAATSAVRSRAAGPPLVDESVITMALQAMAAPQLAALIGAFLAEGPQTVERLRAAVRDAQPLALRSQAHAARGAALNLGLSGLAATAGALQAGGAHLPAHEVARLVQRFEDQLLPTRQAVAALASLAEGGKEPAPLTDRSTTAASPADGDTLPRPRRETIADARQDRPARPAGTGPAAGGAAFKE